MITFTTGLMGSGKSKELIERFLKDRRKKIALAANLTEKTGTEGIITSRNGQSVKAIYLNHEDPSGIVGLIRELANMRNISTIYIDEVQFLTERQILDIIQAAKYYNMSVHFFGLSIDFMDIPFAAAVVLCYVLPEENIVNLPIMCERTACFRDAEHNARIVNGKVAREGETFLEEKSEYIALCDLHYFSKKL